MGWYERFPPYVSVAQRIANARKQVAKLEKKGQAVTPIKIEGRKISETFWGQSWCKNLEAYSDMANRLPRGRSYVRNGSVVDLQIRPGQVSALVAGSSLYEIDIQIKPLPATSWKALSAQCAGQIASIIELLSGRLSRAVMEIITHPQSGLFPKPAEIKMDCSCPDGAYMCKHIAAVLYGVGRRLDDKPELLFLLRKVNHLELIQHAGDIATVTNSTTTSATLADTELADVFGIELETASPPSVSPPKAPPKKAAASPVKRPKPRKAATKTKGVPAKRSPPKSTRRSEARKVAKKKPTRRT